MIRIGKERTWIAPDMTYTHQSPPCGACLCESCNISPPPSSTGPCRTNSMSFESSDALHRAHAVNLDVAYPIQEVVLEVIP
jgi:hypothetical protein